jgi:hypothetical protein
MKKLLIIMMLLVFAGVALGAMTYGVDNYKKHMAASLRYGTNDPIRNFITEVETALEAFTLESDTYITLPAEGYILFTPDDDAPTGAEGVVWMDDTNNVLTYHNGTSWVTLTAGTGDNTLDHSYDQGGSGSGKKVDVDSGAIEFEVDAQSNNGALLLDCDDTNNIAVLLIETVGTSTSHIAIDVDGQSTGRDFEGSGALSYIDGDGAITCGYLNVSTVNGGYVDITGSGGLILSQDATITNATDSEIRFTEASENIALDFVSNGVDFKTYSDVATIGWGDLDAHTGLNTLAFDAAASSITLTADGAGDDFTISVAGATDSSLVLTSSGTGADSTQLRSSAGGIDILATSATSGEDIDIVATGSSVNIEATEGVADAITINASTAVGGIDITSNADIDMESIGAAGEDITIINNGGSLNLIASEADAAAIVIDANTDAGGGIDVDFGSGNMVVVGNGASADFTLDCDLFSIDGTGAANVSVTGGAGEDLTLSQLGTGNASLILASAGDGTDAISLTTSDGTGDIDLNAGDAITIDANDIVVTTEEAVADQFKVDATGAIAGDAINFETTDGGIMVNADGAANGDIEINAADQMLLASANDMTFTLTAGAANEDFLIQTSGAQDCHLTLTSTGTSANALALQTDGTGGGIDIDTDDGAISIVADGSANGDITIDAQDQITIVSTDADGTGTIYIHANGGANEDIRIHADQGTAADSIDIDSDEGGITVTADAANGAGLLTLNSLVCVGAAGTLATDATPDVSTGSYWETGGAQTYTDFDVGSGTVAEGTIIIIKSLHAAVFDVTGSELEGGTTDLTTASGDMTAWIYDGASKWKLLFFMDMSDDLS